MAVTTVNLPAIRLAIKDTLTNSIPTLKRVHDYDIREDEANMPYATIWRDQIRRPDINSPEDMLYHRRYEVDWTLRVYTIVRDPAESQEQHDDFIRELIAGFDEEPLLDPNGEGVVDMCRVVVADSVHVPADASRGRAALMLTEATLVTLIEV